MKSIIATILIISVLVLSAGIVRGQDNDIRKHSAGINLLQIPATTIDLTYDYSPKAYFSYSFGAGYTFDYTKNFDLVGFFLSPHYKCGNYGYVMKQRSGGFLRAGMKYHFSRTLEKQNFFFVGGFLTGSVIREEAEYEGWDTPVSPPENLSHTLIIPGMTTSIGYQFRISGSLHSAAGVQFSFPSAKYADLYGYTHYIPGMGFRESCGSRNTVLFPMVFLNLNICYLTNL
jgi:hypothetical protein